MKNFSENLNGDCWEGLTQVQHFIGPSFTEPKWTLTDKGWRLMKFKIIECPLN